MWILDHFVLESIVVILEPYVNLFYLLFLGCDISQDCQADLQIFMEAGKCAALLMNSFRGRREVHKAPFASHPASQNVTRLQNGYGFIYKKPVGFSLGNFSTRHWKPRCICSKFWLCLTDKLMLVSFTRWCYAHKPRECKHGGAWITALPDYDSVSHRGSCNLA